MQEAERLHDQGRFEESIQVLGDAEKAALSAIARQQPEQAAVIKANPPNAEVSPQAVHGRPICDSRVLSIFICWGNYVPDFEFVGAC